MKNYYYEDPNDMIIFSCLKGAIIGNRLSIVKLLLKVFKQEKNNYDSQIEEQCVPRGRYLHLHRTYFLNVVLLSCQDDSNLEITKELFTLVMGHPAIFPSFSDFDLLNAYKEACDHNCIKTLHEIVRLLSKFKDENLQHIWVHMILFNPPPFVINDLLSQIPYHPLKEDYVSVFFQLFRMKKNRIPTAIYLLRKLKSEINYSCAEQDSMITKALENFHDHMTRYSTIDTYEIFVNHFIFLLKSLKYNYFPGHLEFTRTAIAHFLNIGIKKGKYDTHLQIYDSESVKQQKRINEMFFNHLFKEKRKTKTNISFLLRFFIPKYIVRQVIHPFIAFKDVII